MAFDEQYAITLGHLLESVYDMYSSNAPDPLRPPTLLPQGYVLTAWIQMSDFFLGRRFIEFYGILATRDDDPNDLFVAIRGTQGNTEAWDNAHAGFTAFDPTGRISGAVHSGFFEIYKTLIVDPVKPTGMSRDEFTALTFERQVAATINKESPPGAKTLTVIGHSLGAALATFFSVKAIGLPNVTIPLLCTFASPRVGDAAFATSFDKTNIESWRIVNRADIVPDVPFSWMGYVHVGGLELYDSTGIVYGSEHCAHSLNTYLHLVGDPDAIIDGKCRPAPQDLFLARKAADSSLTSLRNNYDERLKI